MKIIGLDPTTGPLERHSTATGKSRSLAPRPTTLSGQIIGLVANGLGRGEVMLDALFDQLRATDDILGVVKVVKASVSIPPDEQEWARLTRGATVAITGFGG